MKRGCRRGDGVACAQRKGLEMSKKVVIGLMRQRRFQAAKWKTTGSKRANQIRLYRCEARSPKASGQLQLLLPFRKQISCCGPTSVRFSWTAGTVNPPTKHVSSRCQPTNTMKYGCRHEHSGTSARPVCYLELGPRTSFTLWVQQQTKTSDVLPADSRS